MHRHYLLYNSTFGHFSCVLASCDTGSSYCASDLSKREVVACKHKSGSAGQAMVKQLGKQRVNNLFTHLRKIAQHPLLVRNLYTEAQVGRLVTIAHQRWAC